MLKKLKANTWSVQNQLCDNSHQVNFDIVTSWVSVWDREWWLVLLIVENFTPSSHPKSPPVLMVSQLNEFDNLNVAWNCGKHREVMQTKLSAQRDWKYSTHTVQYRTLWQIQKQIFIPERHFICRPWCNTSCKNLLIVVMDLIKDDLKIFLINPKFGICFVLVVKLCTVIIIPTILKMCSCAVKLSNSLIVCHWCPSLEILYYSCEIY